MNKPLAFTLHSPITKFHTTQFICTHDRIFARRFLQRFEPIGRQRTSSYTAEFRSNCHRARNDVPVFSEWNSAGFSEGISATGWLLTMSRYSSRERRSIPLLLQQQQHSVRLTNNTLFNFLRFQLKNVFLCAEIGLVAGFHFENEAFDERTSVTSFRVGIRIPRFLFDLHCTGRKDGLEPGGQMSFDVINFEGILSVSARSVRIGLVLDNFDATSRSVGFFSAFFLKKNFQED